MRSAFPHTSHPHFLSILILNDECSQDDDLRSVYAIFEGTGGSSKAIDFAATNIPAEIMNQVRKEKDVVKVIERAFVTTGDIIAKKNVQEVRCLLHFDRFLLLEITLSSSCHRVSRMA